MSERTDVQEAHIPSYYKDRKVSKMNYVDTEPLGQRKYASDKVYMEIHKFIGRPISVLNFEDMRKLCLVRPDLAEKVHLDLFIRLMDILGKEPELPPPPSS